MKNKFLIFATIIVLSFCFAGAKAQDEAAAHVPSLEAVQIYKKDIARIEEYLNGLNTVVAPFIQTSSDGDKSDGVFYLQRPGRLRWEYYPPSPILIIAKGSLLTYYDKELNQVSHIPLDNSLSGFLTRKTISFDSEDVKIIKFVKENGLIEVTIALKDNEEDGQLTMIFSDEKLELQGMSVLDAIGKTTEVKFSTIVYDKPLDNDLFTMPKVK